jgi:YjbE family integral membrane protein
VDLACDLACRAEKCGGNDRLKMDLFSSPAFWVAFGNIILVNIVLSGDNAVVIALAARSLSPAQQKKAVFYGCAGAVVLRIILTVFALQLLTLPYLKIIGAILLFYVGVQLMADEDEQGHIQTHASMWAAVRTILIADLVMSLDNVLGVAAAAQGNVTLLIIGLAISIPLIVSGSTLILRLMERFPIIIVLGAALLGYLAGEMLFSDVATAAWIHDHLPNHDLPVPGMRAMLSVPGVIGAVAIVMIGRWLTRRQPSPAANR